jgi:hypothetical protein
MEGCGGNGALGAAFAGFLNFVWEGGDGVRCSEILLLEIMEDLSTGLHEYKNNKSKLSTRMNIQPLALPASRADLALYTLSVTPYHTFTSHHSVAGLGINTAKIPSLTPDLSIFQLAPSIFKANVARSYTSMTDGLSRNSNRPSFVLLYFR